MAITTFISNEKKKQQNLLYIFIALLIIGVIILWQFFLKDFLIVPLPKESSLAKQTSATSTSIIDFDFLKSPLLNNLQDFEKPLLPPQENIGKGNPFLP